MRIVDLIHRDVVLILPQLRATNKQDVIHELASCVGAHFPGLDPAVIEHALTAREKRGSTAVDDGLAIPHARLHSIRDRIIGCFGRSRKGIDFDALDGKPTHFFFMLIAPDDPAGAHLKVLARVSKLFRNKEFRERLTTAETAQEIYETFAAAEPK